VLIKFFDIDDGLNL
jgi:hypothetical protein